MTFNIKQKKTQNCLIKGASKSLFARALVHAHHGRRHRGTTPNKIMFA